MSFTLNKYFSKNELRLILICIFIRLFLFSLYNYKVSECPDSWAFNHFSEKLSEHGKLYFHKLFEEQNNNVTQIDTNQILSEKGNSKKGSFIGERSPGYPLFIFIASGKSGAVFLQFLLGIITALLWYRTLLKLKFSTQFSFFTVVLLQCFLSIFIYETFILVETLVLFFISVIAYIISDEYLTTEKSIKFEIFFGFFLGYLVLIKPFYVVIPCILFGLRFINKPNVKSVLNRKLIILIAPLVLFFGWSLVVQKFTGYFTATTYFGINKIQNCVYFAEKGPKEYDWIIEPYAKHREITIKENKEVSMSIWYAINAGEFKYKNMEFADLSNEFGKFADATIKANFQDYLTQVITKSWFDFWITYDIKEFIKYENQNIDFWITKISYIQNLLFTILKFLFLPISLFYSYLFLVKKALNFQTVFSILIWCISILQALTTYGTNGKYSFPFEFLIVFIVLLFFRDFLLNRNLVWNKGKNSFSK